MNRKKNIGNWDSSVAKVPHKRAIAFEKVPCSATRLSGDALLMFSVNSRTRWSKQTDCMAIARPVARSAARQHFKGHVAAPGGCRFCLFLRGCF